MPLNLENTMGAAYIGVVASAMYVLNRDHHMSSAELIPQAVCLALQTCRPTYVFAATLAIAYW